MSSFFLLRRSNTETHIDGPDIKNVKITVENLCIALQQDAYADGLDPMTTCNMLADFYKWITGTLGDDAISLPAPATDLEDRHRKLLPEGSRVSTRARRSSTSSKSSNVSRNSKGAVVPNISAAYTSSRASSTTSSRYAPVRHRFIEEDDYPEDEPRTVSLKEVRMAEQRHLEQLRNQRQPPVQDSGHPRRADSDRREPSQRARRTQPRLSSDPVEEEVEYIDTSRERRSLPRRPAPPSRGTTRGGTRRFVEDE